MNKNHVFFGGVCLRKSDIEAVKGCCLFSGLSDSQLNEILSSPQITVSTYKRHAPIFTPSSYMRSLAVITKGKADVYKQTDKGALFLSILPSGGVFGMAALFYEENGFINSVSARTDCRVCFIPKEYLERIFINYPHVAQNYITVLSQKIHYLNAKIANLASPSPAVRLLSYLQALDGGNDGEINLPVSMSELSKALSLGRTSLYNAFDELSANGVIERDGKTIRILTPKGIE